MDFTLSVEILEPVKKFAANNRYVSLGERARLELH